MCSTILLYAGPVSPLCELGDDDFFYFVTSRKKNSLYTERANRLNDRIESPRAAGNAATTYVLLPFNFSLKHKLIVTVRRLHQ